MQIPIESVPPTPNVLQHWGDYRTNHRWRPRRPSWKLSEYIRARFILRWQRWSLVDEALAVRTAKSNERDLPLPRSLWRLFRLRRSSLSQTPQPQNPLTNQTPDPRSPPRQTRPRQTPRQIPRRPLPPPLQPPKSAIHRPQRLRYRLPSRH